MKKLDERTRAGLFFALKLAVAVLAVTVTLSVISYLFTWKADQSLTTGSGEAANAAASGGFSIGHFLVTQSFGLAALPLVVVLILWAVKLFWPQSPYSMKRWFWGCLGGTFLGSWILAYGSILFGGETLFAGGLGGRAGAGLVACRGMGDRGLPPEPGRALALFPEPPFF